MRLEPFSTIKFFISLLLVVPASQNPALTADAPMSAELRAMLSDVDRLGARHDFERAIPIAEAAVAKYPNNYIAHVKRGFVYLYLEEEVKALADFDWALKRKPDDWKVLEYLSTVYTATGKDDLALLYVPDSVPVNTSPASSPMSGRTTRLRRARITCESLRFGRARNICESLNEGECR